MSSRTEDAFAANLRFAAADRRNRIDLDAVQWGISRKSEYICGT